ncbi:MAG: cupin domain-containing protein [Azonexus sp.]|jgi:mannose-6-phosphate isomerase-like protein (cupin superfamily)|nr:cupin domain-containing protein [Betaproteobacteria bacterium]MBK8917662.1 cupin domain-containing protein [Betaproteobacteria bacterium]MBP6037070.1 cupin domain-containing protein [Azonexus sp.]MBP6907535.1 cupin domain-containing protein [Azonexus sp.]
MSVLTRRDAIASYTTLDGSAIRELLHPDAHPVRQQSLAEATVPVGGATRLHRHRTTEEIYHLTRGRGRMVLGEESFPVATGDTILIPPGMPHCIENLGEEPLTILCCCAPAYTHSDTELL